MCQGKGFWLWLLKVVALLGLLALCLWLILRPKSPSYTIVDISVPPTSNDTISYSLEFQNPSTDSSIYYDDIFLTFTCSEETVGQNKIGGFRQGKASTKVYTDHVIPDNLRVWKDLRRAVLNATAELKVALSTTVRYKTLGIKSKHHGMNMQAHVKIGPDGKISGKNKKIKLRHAAKKWKMRNAFVRLE